MISLVIASSTLCLASCNTTGTNNPNGYRSTNMYSTTYAAPGYNTNYYGVGWNNNGWYGNNYYNVGYGYNSYYSGNRGYLYGANRYRYRGVGYYNGVNRYHYNRVGYRNGSVGYRPMNTIHHPVRYRSSSLRTYHNSRW